MRSGHSSWLNLRPHAGQKRMMTVWPVCRHCVLRIPVCLNSPVLLKTYYAKLYAEVKVVRDENKIVGYIISAVDVVVAGAAIFGGIVMMSSMTAGGRGGRCRDCC